MKRIEVKGTPFVLLKAENGVIRILCGDTLASRRTFKSEKAAIAEIKRIDWDMIFIIVNKIITLREYEQFKNEQNQGMQEVQETKSNSENLNQ